MRSLTGPVLVLTLITMTRGFSVEEEPFSSRQPKLIFGSAVSQAEITELRSRLDKLEERTTGGSEAGELNAIRERVTRLEGGVPGGYETFEDAKKNFTAVFSNITNIYEKVKVLRAANKLKCSVKKCDNIRTKLKKVTQELEILKNINLTELTVALTQFSNLTTKITTLETSIATMTDNATKQQAEIETLKTQVVTLQTGITTNAASITKQNNCFLDINSADCPTSKRRSGRSLDDTEETEEEQEGLVITDYDDFELGPHPSLILKDIFRSSKLDDMKKKFRKKRKNKKANRQTSGTLPLVSNLKVLIECMTDPTSTQCGTIYSAATTLPKLVSSTCPSSTCTTLTSDMTTVKSCLTSPTDSGCSYTAATNLPALVSSVSTDLTPIKGCMTDPTAAGCTGTYSGAATLPKITSNMAACMTDPTASTCTTAYSAASTLPKTLTGKCDQTTCTTLTTDMTTVKSCLTSPTDSGCSYTASTNLPALVSSVSTDLTPIKSCMTDPSASGCTGTYSTGTMPGIVTGLSTDLTPIKGCMTDPTSTACTGTYSAAATLPKSFTNIAACMTDPTTSTCTTAYSASSTLPKSLTSKCDQSTCTTLNTDMTTVKSCLTSPTASGCSGTYSASTTLPVMLSQVDKCMTNVEDTTCTASYGASANLVSGGGKSIVGYVKQLIKPAMVTCGLGGTQVTFGSTAVASATPEGCSVSKFYEVLKFTCKHTEPDKTDKYHMELDDDSADSTTKVKIKQDGWYSISFTALLITNDKQNRAEIFKISSKNPDSSCAAATASCEALLQLRGKDTTVAWNADATLTQTNQRTTAGEGLYYLCADDQLTAIASMSGSAAVPGNVAGDNDFSRTIFTVSKVTY